VRRLLLVGCSAVAIGCAALAGCSDDGSSADSTAARPTGDGRVGGREITRAELRQTLRDLQRIADEHDGNRAAGSGGGEVTVDYVAARLQRAGWRVHREPVAFPYFDERQPSRVSVGSDRLRRGRDFTTLAYSGSGRVEGTATDVGDGCDAEDFPDRDGVGSGTGRSTAQPMGVAVAERGRCFFRVKARRAQRAGYAALLAVDRGGGERAPSGTLGAPGTRIPVLLLSGAAGAQLADGERVALTVDAVSERRRSANVIAQTTAGSRGQRVVMAGAHLDSVPAGPGINDNGSGVAALLALADALGGRAPGAPVRLGFWTAEELGLIGSRRYVASLDRAQRRRIAAYVNLDMVGSPNATLYVNVGDRRVERTLRRLVGRGAVRTDPGGQTDSAPFRRAGIPVSGLFSGASRREDPCYHRACDDLDNVDLATLQRLARVAAKAVERLSAQPPR
jgi:Peptidase family M28/PA domain